jgi:hypothetical protein
MCVCIYIYEVYAFAFSAFMLVYSYSYIYLFDIHPDPLPLDVKTFPSGETESTASRRTRKRGRNDGRWLGELQFVNWTWVIRTTENEGVFSVWAWMMTSLLILSSGVSFWRVIIRVWTHAKIEHMEVYGSIGPQFIDWNSGIVYVVLSCFIQA